MGVRPNPSLSPKEAELSRAFQKQLALMEHPSAQEPPLDRGLLASMPRDVLQQQAVDAWQKTVRRTGLTATLVSIAYQANRPLPELAERVGVTEVVLSQFIAGTHPRIQNCSPASCTRAESPIQPSSRTSSPRRRVSVQLIARTDSF